MTLMEVLVAIIAVSALVTGIAVMIGVAHLLPLIRDANGLVRDANQTIVRVNRMAEDAEAVLQDARKLEHRLSATVGGVLDQVEPLMRIFNALSTAFKIGTAALVRGRPPG